MRSRCSNPNAPDYKHYGGRGITVCESWFAFENFLADMGERPEGLRLDRINKNGHFEPENCRWATYKGRASGNGNGRGRATGMNLYRRSLAGGAPRVRRQGDRPGS